MKNGLQIPVSHYDAERTRFELVVRLPVRQFSKLLVSATHPPLQSTAFVKRDCKYTVIFLILLVSYKKYCTFVVY